MRLTLLCISLLAFNASGFEMLVKARSVAHPDADEDRRGRLKLGMIADIRGDGFQWGTMENMPRYTLIKVPMVDASAARKYLAAQYLGTDDDGNPLLYRARLWQLRLVDLPADAKTKLANGLLVIKATEAYTGEFDYTWTQVKTFIRNLETGLDETNDL